MLVASAGMSRLVLAVILLGVIALLAVSNNKSLSPNLYAQLSQCWYRPKFTNSDVSRIVKGPVGSSVKVPLYMLQSNEVHRFKVQTSQSTPRVAICLVGGARAFELTGESIRRYLLDIHREWDVFLHAPLDKDAHKFTLLRNASNLVSARIFRPHKLVESELELEVLHGGTSPNGVQGLLQYFKLVEGCLNIISQYETTHNFQYEWVLRTRVDGYWSGPLPPLTSLNSSVYYVPTGSQFGGFNDRFGLGTRNTTVAALSRLSLLPFLHARGRRSLNSETAFKAQLEELGVPCEPISLPFCILSRRKYSGLLHPNAVPVASIATKGALSGAKCRPCTPIATGSAAQAAVSKLHKKWGWPGHVRGLELCNAEGDWESNWEENYVKATGKKISMKSQRVLTRTSKECIKDIDSFQKAVGGLGRASS